MRKPYYLILTFCMMLILSLLSGCWGGIGKPNIQLTEEQETAIDMIVQNRDEWKEYKDFVDCVPANRIYMAEFTAKDGAVWTWMTVGYVKENPKSNVETFMSIGYVTKGDRFSSINMTHEKWIVDSISIDLESMTDEELREVLRMSYIAYLEKESKK